VVFGRQRRLVTALIVLATACSSVLAAAPVLPDYAREQRWADEIVPAIVVGDPVWLSTPSRARVLAVLTEAAQPKGGVIGSAIVLHGAGVHPDWGLTGTLRERLAGAGITTLSVQMPVLAADAPAEAYAALQPFADERIAAAVAFLRARGETRIAIVAHSAGAAMANRYLARPGVASIAAFVAIGMQGDFAIAPREPVLDIVARSDLPAVLDAAPRRKDQLPNDACSRAVVIDGADHFMAARLNELVAATLAFLDRALAGRCSR
jgi:hypothetical protein